MRRNTGARRAMQRAFHFLPTGVFLVLASCGAVAEDGSVIGVVVDRSGQPAAGVPVAVGGTTVTTDATGHFTIGDAPAVYDAALATPDRKHAYFHQGMRSRRPTFKLDELVGRTWRSTRVHIELPDQANFIPAVLGADASELVVEAGFDATDLTVLWSGSDAAVLALVALHATIDPQTGAATHYDGYASQRMPLTDGGALSWKPDLAPPSFGEHGVSVTVDASASAVSYVEARLLVRIVGSPSAVPLLPDGQGHGVSAPILLPELPDATLDLEVMGVSKLIGYASSVVRDIGRAAPPIPITLDAPARALSPEDEASAIGVGSTLAWSNPAGGAAIIKLFPNQTGQSNAPTLTLLTTANQIDVPDLGALGITLPSGVRYDWVVRASSAFTTIEAASDLAPYSDQARSVGTSQRSVTTR